MGIPSTQLMFLGTIVSRATAMWPNTKFHCTLDVLWTQGSKSGKIQDIPCALHTSGKWPKIGAVKGIVFESIGGRTEVRGMHDPKHLFKNHAENINKDGRFLLNEHELKVLEADGSFTIGVEFEANLSSAKRIDPWVIKAGSHEVSESRIQCMYWLTFKPRRTKKQTVKGQWAKIATAFNKWIAELAPPLSFTTDKLKGDILELTSAPAMILHESVSPLNIGPLTFIDPQADEYDLDYRDKEVLSALQLESRIPHESAIVVDPKPKYHAGQDSDLAEDADSPQSTLYDDANLQLRRRLCPDTDRDP